MGVDVRSAPGVNKAGDTMTGPLTIVQGAAATVALSSKVTGDAFNRWQVTEDGTQSWGDGTAAPGTGGENLYFAGLGGGSIGTDASTFACNNAQVQAKNGTAASPSFSFSGDATMGVYRAAASKLAFSIGSAEIARIGSLGLEIGSTGAPGTVEKFRVNLPTTVSNTANAIIAASATTATPLIVQGIASQSAVLFQIQNSAGTNMLSFSASSVITLADGGSFAGGTSSGTKIGTATTQKLGFFNVTPVIQPASANQAAVAATGATNLTPYGYTTAAQADAIVTLVNQIRSDLVALGILKGAA